MRSAAWRISLWATLAFALGSMLVFMMLLRFVAQDIQRRSDAWISGEVQTLRDVAERTPNDRLYGQVVGEVAELASNEVPNRSASEGYENHSVWFLQTGADGALKLWVGDGNGKAEFAAINATKSTPDVPYDIHVAGFGIPFRVASVRIADGSKIYLGLSERDEMRVLRALQLRFLWLYVLIVLIGFAVVFYATRRMLGFVRQITEAASGIGQSDLRSRVPAGNRNDEIGQLARTLNGMLDRIENSVHQLHTMTDSLAHDLRSPLTAIRGKLEITLLQDGVTFQKEPIVSAIDELDRLSEVLTRSLDVAEARADALRLNPVRLDVDELIRVMVDLYEPCMSEKGLRLKVQSGGPLQVMADAALFHRVIANLLDNELKHLPPACTICIVLHADENTAHLQIEDDGPGFDLRLQDHVFEQGVKGAGSKGHGLGLAFVGAVVRAHGGQVSAGNKPEGGARLCISLPVSAVDRSCAVSEILFA